MIRAVALLCLAGLGSSVFAAATFLPNRFAPLLGVNAESSIVLGATVRVRLAAQADPMLWRHYLLGALLSTIATGLLHRVRLFGSSEGRGLAVDLGLAAAQGLVPAVFLGAVAGIVLEALSAPGGRGARSPILTLPAAWAGAGLCALVLGFGIPGVAAIPDALTLATASGFLVVVGLLLVAAVEWTIRNAPDAGSLPSAVSEEVGGDDTPVRFLGLDAALAGLSLALVATVLCRVATLSFGDTAKAAALIDATLLLPRDRESRARAREAALGDGRRGDRVACRRVPRSAASRSRGRPLRRPLGCARSFAIKRRPSRSIWRRPSPLRSPRCSFRSGSSVRSFQPWPVLSRSRVRPAGSTLSGLSVRPSASPSAATRSSSCSTSTRSFA
jgi:hypothetical protein